jgi:hypothetical protein
MLKVKIKTISEPVNMRVLFFMIFLLFSQRYFDQGVSGLLQHRKAIAA